MKIRIRPDRRSDIEDRDPPTMAGVYYCHRQDSDGPANDNRRLHVANT